MLSICAKCGSHEWNKEVEGKDKSRIKCPKCGYTWSSKALPLFILTGCSGVGKTTTGLALQQKDTDFVVLDADFFTIMPSRTVEDWAAHVEHLQNISADIMQSGKPVLWTMAGNLDRLMNTYNARFFSNIYCLALVCEANELRRRMREGRHITDEKWIEDSVQYNQYFMEHENHGDTQFERLDITNMNSNEIADYVIDWTNKHMKNPSRG